MKISSDLVWAVILVALATASYFLGVKRGSLSSEDLIEEQEKQIGILQKENQQLSKELESRGIFSYPQANVISKMEDSVALALITLNGKEPISDLKLRRKLIYNYSEVNSLENLEQGKITDLGTLRPHSPAAFEIPLTGKEIAMHLEYTSRQKKWHQYIWIRKSKGGKIHSFWVITNKNSVIIDKHIDQNFPTDPEGQVVLWKNEKIDYSNLEMSTIFPPAP